MNEEASPARRIMSHRSLRCQLSGLRVGPLDTHRGAGADKDGQGWWTRIPPTGFREP